MEAGALLPYERALHTGTPLTIRHRSGRISVLDVPRWLAPADEADDTVLRRCAGPVLDIGCGPGRILASLKARRIQATGIDIAGRAVRMGRRRNLDVRHGSVFAPDDCDGTWATCLLLDGNIGIGGDPVRLLTRVRRLMSEDGQVVVETHPNDGVDDRAEVRFARGDRPEGPPFRWAQVGAHHLARHAQPAGLEVRERWVAFGRTFTILRAA